MGLAADVDAHGEFGRFVRQTVFKEAIMKKGKTFFVLIVVLVIFLGLLPAREKSRQSVIQMVILLDTSGSMEGLIEQAKTQLWKIVNEMALAKKNGKVPRLLVGLYEYGKSTIPASEGYLRMLVPLSEDLDRISEELFKLKTNGGQEYCGKVIRAATRGLQWSQNNSDYKVVFIAGNEPFTQGDVDYKTACRSAIEKGIVVNTIFCGNYEQGIRTFWKDGADLADGKYMNIDQNQKIVHISAPQDKAIVKLGQELNQTYIAYGKAGKGKKERQKRQDKNALSVNEEVMVQRSVAKSSPQYSNATWDMVDAVKEGKVKIEDMKEEDLPEELKKMNKRERVEYVNKLKKKREDIQTKINKLNREREKYVTQKRKEISDELTLDEVLVKAIKEQASKKNYKFEKK